MLKKIFLFIFVILNLIPSFILVEAGNITESTYMIEANGLSPIASGTQSGTPETVTIGIIENVIDSLIISFGVLALIVMSIGAGYMIIYSGQEELLSKGKSIFMAGLISLIVALLSGLIVNFVNVLLYD